MAHFNRAARRSTKSAWIQTLEPRRLLAAPVVGGSDYAAATDTYALTLHPTSSTTTFPDTPVTSVAWNLDAATTYAAGGGISVGKPQYGSFDVTLPSGAVSLTFLTLISTGDSLDLVQIDSRTAKGQLRMTWTLQAVYLSQFTQEDAPDGTLQDRIHFIYRQIDTTFYRYRADGTVLDSQTLSANVVTGVVLGPPAFDGYFMATQPNVSETIEMGGGQIPLGDFSTGVIADTTWTGGGGASVGKPIAQGIGYNTVDGRDNLTIAYSLCIGRGLGNAIYTRRNPTTGAATQRYRFGAAFVTHYGFSDSVFDDLPRQAGLKMIAPRYQLVSYRYDGESQSSTSVGFDYSATGGSAVWNNSANGAHLAGPTDETRNTPIDSLTFRLLTPATLTKSSFVFEGIDPAAITLIGSNGDRTWTLEKLAGQQRSDGRFAVKLFADSVNTLRTSSTSAALFIGSAGKSWNLDRSTPALVASSFNFDAAPPTPYAFDFKLSEPITASAVDGTAPILIRRLDTGALITTATAHVASDSITLRASLGNTLADARYRATLPAGSVRDAAGNLLASDLDLPFFVLAGDANHDAAVDFDDLVILSQNYNLAGRSFATGNFNYDAAGKVDFDDLVILSQQYGKTLLPLPLIAPTSRGSSAGTKRDRTVNAIL